MSTDVKLPRGSNPWPPGHSKPPTTLEKITLVHVGMLVVGAAWFFGGNTELAQLVLSWWGSLGAIITLVALRDEEARARGYHRPVRWLWPFGLFNLLVLASALNPSFRTVLDGAQRYYVESHGIPGLPSSARPILTLRALWFFDAAYISCFNLALVVRSRQALRALLLAIAANALLLAVFGTIQKLMGAKALFFGLKKTPQLHFFASFIYSNHWGAFTILMCAIAIALIVHYARSHTARDLWHTPVPAGLLAAFLLGASVLLSGSRSGTALVAVLFVAGLLRWLAGLLFARDRARRPTLLPIAAATVGLAVAGVASYNLARPVIAQRLADTHEQLAEMRAQGGLGSRSVLYRDTWNTAREHLVFGWGMASFPTVFYHRNTQQNLPGRFPMYFHDAHSDWLQSLSDVGLVGTLLLCTCAGVPLYLRRRTLRQSQLILWLLAGCGLIVLYATVEFPFGNRAVVIAWWFCFFTAVHYGRLDGTELP